MATESRILAYALAHEIGQALLDLTEHPRHGILPGHSSPCELQACASKNWSLSEPEVALLRTEAARRVESSRKSSTESRNVPNDHDF